jgi:pimeloyl-ACP methyl ester carboxylesterase
MIIIHRRAATVSRKTKKARLRMLSGKLNVTLLMTDGAANHFHVIAPTDTKLSPIPSSAVSAFPDELYQDPQSWTEKAYPKLIHYNRVPKGGHFAAWEQPVLFAAEIRAAFRPLR